MPLRQRDLWIFDLDGTLTVAAHDFVAIRAELGLPPDEPILEALGRIPAAQAAALLRRLDEIELAIARSARAADGAHTLLAALCESGARVGILTRNSERNARATLAACGLDAFFAAGSIVDRDAAAPKPSPAGVMRLLGGWRGTPERSVVVGDYLFDLQAGREAGALTVHVDPSGRFGWSEYADLEVRSLTELEAHARRRGRRS
jgi:HAD superfamily hydrolase (TIGR01509 family)